MGHAQQARAGRVEFAPQQAFERIGHGAAQRRQAHDRHLLGLQQGLRHRVGVGPHQPARAQLDAAEVAHHGGEHAFQILVPQHVEHRPPGGAARLAVIHRRRLPAGEQRPAHVARAGMLRPQFRHHLLRARAVGHRLHAADEAALLDDQFAVDGGGEGLRHGGDFSR